MIWHTFFYIRDLHTGELEEVDPDDEVQGDWGAKPKFNVVPDLLYEHVTDTHDGHTHS